MSNVVYGQNAAPQTTSTEAGRMGQVVPERTGAWPPTELGPVTTRLGFCFGRPENGAAKGVRPSWRLGTGVPRLVHLTDGHRPRRVLLS